jgi:hypothetical protein
MKIQKEGRDMFRLASLVRGLGRVMLLALLWLPAGMKLAAAAAPTTALFPTQSSANSFGSTIMYWSNALGYDVPVTDTVGLPVVCLSGCSGGGGGGGGAVTGAVGAFVDGWDVTLGTMGDSAYAGSGSASGIAALKGIYTQTAAVLALMPSKNGDNGALSHITNFPATQPVSLASLPNVTIGAPLPASTNNIGSVGVAQGSTTAGQYGPLMQCAVLSGTASDTTAQTDPLECTSQGNLHVTAYSAGNIMSGPVANGVGAGGAVAALTYITAPTEVTTTNAQAQQGDPYGGTFVNNEGLLPTDGSFASFTPTTGVLWSECGSASKTIHIKSLMVSGYAGTAGSYVLSVMKTSTAPSGGTATALVFVAATTVGATSNTATGNLYTAPPTGGTSIGAEGGGIVPFPVVGGVSPAVQLLPTGPGLGTQSIALAGVAQCVEISTSTTALTTPTMTVAEVHTEQ